MPSLDTLIIIAVNLLSVIITAILVNRGNKMPYKPFNIHRTIQSIIEKPASIHSPSKRLATSRAIKSLTQ